jgi:hypothetical protein
MSGSHIAVPVGAAAIVRTGGGGWGDPLQRDPRQVCEHVAEALLSATAASKLYGVVLRRNMSLDERATKQLRDPLRSRLQLGDVLAAALGAFLPTVEDGRQDLLEPLRLKQPVGNMLGNQVVELLHRDRPAPAGRLALETAPQPADSGDGRRIAPLGDSRYDRGRP